MPQPPPPVNPLAQMGGFPQDMGGFNAQGGAGMFPGQSPLSDLSENSNSMMPPPMAINAIGSPDGTSANQSGDTVSTDNTLADGKDTTSLSSLGMPSGPSVILQQQQLMNQNVCEKHFPEPIIYMSEQPLCKKCIPEYMDEMRQKAQKANKNNNDEGKDAAAIQQSKDQERMLVAKMLGLAQFGQNNLYQSEKTLIQKYLFKMDDFNGDFRYIHDEIEERAQDSIDNLENLPELMCQIFSHCEKNIERNKKSFINEIDEVIKKQ